MIYAMDSDGDYACRSIWNDKLIKQLQDTCDSTWPTTHKWRPVTNAGYLSFVPRYIGRPRKDTRRHNWRVTDAEAALMDAYLKKLRGQQQQRCAIILERLWGI